MRIDSESDSKVIKIHLFRNNQVRNHFLIDSNRTAPEKEVNQF